MITDPSLRTPAIVGTAVSGLTICGSYEIPLPSLPSYDDAFAVLRIYSRDESEYVDITNIIGGEVTFTNPFENEALSIDFIYPSIPIFGSKCELYLAKGIKNLIFSGYIEQIKGKPMGKGYKVWNAIIHSKANKLNFVFLDTDWNTGIRSLKTIITEALTKCSLSITNNVQNEVEIGPLSFSKWKTSRLDMIQLICSDVLDFYCIGDLIQICDKNEDIVLEINKNTNILNIDIETSQLDTYDSIVIIGKDDDTFSSPYYYIGGTGYKQMIVENELIDTEYEAKKTAEVLLNKMNKAINAVNISISDFIFPKFGFCRVNIDDLNIVEKIYSYSYSFSKRGLITNIKVGRKIDNLENIIRRILN